MFKRIISYVDTFQLWKCNFSRAIKAQVLYKKILCDFNICRMTICIWTFYYTINDDSCWRIFNNAPTRSKLGHIFFWIRENFWKSLWYYTIIVLYQKLHLSLRALNHQKKKKRNGHLSPDFDLYVYNSLSAWLYVNNYTYSYKEPAVDIG